jgi:hypothetical protein
MTMIPFTDAVPADNSARTSSVVRNSMDALYRGDYGILRARAQASPNMTVAVASSSLESFWQNCWLNYTQPLVYAGGNSPTVTAPVTYPRIDLLTIDSAGTLAWVTGQEAASPVAPDCPNGKIPLCQIYCKTTMTGGNAKIVNFEDAGSFPLCGYIYKDCRPFLNLGSSELPLIVFDIPGILAAGANQTPKFIVPFSCTIIKASAVVTVACTGAAILIDIHKNGTTIWSTQANRLQIPVSTLTVINQTSFNTIDLVEGDLLSLDLDQVGSTIHGSDLSVTIKVQR